VPVRASSYKKTVLKDYQAVLDPAQPLANMTDAERDSGLGKNPESESVDAWLLRLLRCGDIEDLDSIFVDEIPELKSVVLFFSVPPSSICITGLPIRIA
jgi:hypothetical protein